MRSNFHRVILFVAALLMLVSFTCEAASQEDLPPYLKGDGVLTLYRPVKDDLQTFRYRDENGNYSASALDSITHFFRCRMTNEEYPIDPKLVEMLDAIEDHFSGRKIELISAYRSPTRNSYMRRHNRHVAKESFHMRGMAADIVVSGISARQLRDFAYSLNQGGIGYYKRRSFVHVDTGPLRTWGFKPRRSLQRSLPAMSQK